MTRGILAGGFLIIFHAAAQTQLASHIKLALPEHRGQLQWTADGFKTVQTSAKAGGREIGIRAEDNRGQLHLLGFLFVFREMAPLNSATCRDGVMSPEQKGNPSLKILESWKSDHGAEIVGYSTKARDGKTSYAVRGFLANSDVCGDLEVYSSEPIHIADPAVRAIFNSYALDSGYQPLSRDIVLYAQVLFDAHQYKDAAPLYELALAKINDGASPFPSLKVSRRVIIDQAGMSYGIAGDEAKARIVLEKGIAEDPEYPMYYYNLACVDAAENHLEAARDHLKAAFARKANMISGETMPDPTKDDSFTPYKADQKFWSFVEALQAGR